jgi:hypothetical protein
MKRRWGWAAAALLCMMIGTTGCNNEAATPEKAPVSDVNAGAGGTGVGLHSTHGETVPLTGTSTQRTGTGFTGVVSTPGPGQGGR